MTTSAISPDEETAEIRVGSPFDGPSTFVPAPPVGQSPIDLSVARYVAWGATLAAGLILPNAIIAAWFMPIGGIAVAGLGVVLGLAGLSSPRPKMAAVLLVTHAATLAWSVSRMT